MPSLDRLGVPAPGALDVTLRLSPLPRALEFDPASWRTAPFTDLHNGWWEHDLASLGLADGAYEYELVVRWPGAPPRVAVVPDPYAEEATRFAGYRGVLRMRGGHRERPRFDWAGEMSAGGTLPGNNQLVIYELPMRWIDTGADGESRQVGLGTFEKATFARLKQSIGALGANCVELLPVQDSPDTLNWGYGTRFFLAPDVDMGDPFDLKLFVKRCHQDGIRVILDLVMNHAKGCPLRDLAFDWFFLASGDDEKDRDNKPRNGWGGDIFRYREMRDGRFHAREFHHDVAKFLIEEYHIDGFRLDEFKGIDNWDFVRDFTARAHAAHRAALPGRP